jgi:hypothetical protein
MSLDESDPAMSSSNEGSNNPKPSKKATYETNKSNKNGQKSENNKQTVGSNKKAADRPETEAEKVAAETESESSPVSRTVTVDCSLCGKQFGRNSINFHQRQCQRKQQVLKEKQEQEEIEERKMASYIIEEDVGKEILSMYSSIFSQ